MGAIWSRLRRQRTTREQLECIQQEILTIEDHKWTTIRREQNYASLLFFSSLFILIISFTVYAYWLPSAWGWYEKISLTIPLISVIGVVLFLRKALQWYCRWSLDSKQARLRELLAKKRRILEQVIETETYRVARELLEKYDPKLLRQQDYQSAPITSPTVDQHQSSFTSPSSLRPTTTKLLPSSAFKVSTQTPAPTVNRRRTLATSDLNSTQTNYRESQQEQIGDNSFQGVSSFNFNSSKVPHQSEQHQQRNNNFQMQGSSQSSNTHDGSIFNTSDASILNQTLGAGNLSTSLPSSAFPSSTARLNQAQNVQTQSQNLNSLQQQHSSIATPRVRGQPVRPILSQERSFLDKVVDWVVNDGPAARFALICRHCHGHNGMALQEEFETLNFRCCFCFSLNMSKKSLQSFSSNTATTAATSTIAKQYENSLDESKSVPSSSQDEGKIQSDGGKDSDEKNEEKNDRDRNEETKANNEKNKSDNSNLQGHEREDRKKKSATSIVKNTDLRISSEKITKAQKLKLDNIPEPFLEDEQGSDQEGEKDFDIIN